MIHSVPTTLQLNSSLTILADWARPSFEHMVPKWSQVVCLSITCVIYRIFTWINHGFHMLSFYHQLPSWRNQWASWAMAWMFHDLASVEHDRTRISVIEEHMGTQYERGKRWKTDFYEIYDGGTWSSVITSKHLPTPFSITFACFWCGWCSRAPGTNIGSKCSKATFRDQTSQRTGWKHQSCTTQDELQIARWAEQSVNSSYPQENRHNSFGKLQTEN